ncbi:hypothetical protein HYT18_02655 [Candidatus Microgenomates bacterium]|nr:hypothetical protein [Candidatus Microgenomates bacterium]
MKQFYSHIVKIETITAELDKLDLTDEERIHLAHLIDSSLHHTILDAILSQLAEEDKRLFLKHVHEDDHDKIWQFLNEKVDNIEEKIKKAADGLINELHEDIQKGQKEKK